MSPAWFNKDSEKSPQSVTKVVCDTSSPSKAAADGTGTSSPPSRRWSVQAMQQMLPLPMNSSSEKYTSQRTTEQPSVPSPPKPVAGSPTMGGSSRRSSLRCNSTSESSSRRWSMQQMLPMNTSGRQFSSTRTMNLTPRQEFLQEQAQKLKSESDIGFLLDDPEQFAKLKKELRKSGAVTNSVLMHGIHFYARDHAQKVSAQ